ncbi:hypothetical protein FHG87_008176 [Trinorchestia longiramus]|nr:hypothetical protein FHG87_008176 [Trinorchestia longiramus]
MLRSNYYKRTTSINVVYEYKRTTSQLQILYALTVYNLLSPFHESLAPLYSHDQISASTMKVALLCLLALVAVVVGSDVNSYDKVDLDDCSGTARLTGVALAWSVQLAKLPKHHSASLTAVVTAALKPRHGGNHGVRLVGLQLP